MKARQIYLTCIFDMNVINQFAQQPKILLTTRSQHSFLFIILYLWKEIAFVWK